MPYGWQTDTAGRASLPVSYQQAKDGTLRFVVPLSSRGAALSAPDIAGRVRLEVSGRGESRRPGKTPMAV